MKLTPLTIAVGTVSTLTVGGLIWFILSTKSIDPSTALDLCNRNDPQPEIAFETTLTGNIDFRNIQAKTIVMPASATYPNGDPKITSAPPAVTNPITRLDLNMNLSNTTKKPGRVIYKIEDSTIKFQTADNLGVTSVDKNRGMFCLRSVTDKVVIFDVKHYMGGGPKPKHGSINLNLIVPDSVDPAIYSMPISLDPEIKNHG